MAARNYPITAHRKTIPTAQAARSIGLLSTKTFLNWANAAPGTGAGMPPAEELFFTGPNGRRVGVNVDVFAPWARDYVMETYRQEWDGMPVGPAAC